MGDFFITFSENLKMGNAKVEGYVYIAGLPLVFSAWSFFMFSRIARLKVPCLKFEKQMDRFFNWPQIATIAFVFTLIMNSMLFLLALTKIQSKEGVSKLVELMLGLPIVVATVA